MKTAVTSGKAPTPVGPYSIAISFNNLIFTSGQIPINPVNKTIPESIEEQAKQAMENLKTALEAGGSNIDKVIKTTVYLKDMGDFDTVNEIYESFFKSPFPARTCIQVSKLPKDALIEIEAIAAL